MNEMGSMRLIKPRRYPQLNGTVATIGNFDGVHLGHRHVIEALASKGKRLGLPVTVVLFEPQPLEYFLGDKAPARLTRLREKLARLKELPVDWVMPLKFDRSLASLSALEFINQVLLDKLGVKHLVVGDDFRFGRGREGDFHLLQQVGARNGFDVVSTPTFELNGIRVSSTAIRRALEQGDLRLAETLLGRPYSFCGRVVSGAQRGRDLGFPTANINLSRKKSPISGVFAVTVSGVNDKPWPGVANVGIRPTVEGNQKVLLEVHLFDFDGDIYGRMVEVFFHHKIREEMRFPSLEALRKQIENDVAKARNLLQSQENQWITNKP